MKHFLFLAGATLLGGLGAVYHPFWGILLYYSLAVLRPQYMWEWALPVHLRWSLYAAVIVFVSVLINAGRGFFRIRLSMVPLLIVGYAFLLMASVVNAYSPETAEMWAVEYAKILAIGLIASVIIDRLWQVKIMLLMVVVATGYIAWEVNYLYFFNGRLDIFHKGYGGLDNNGAGLMLAMAMPIAYGFAVNARSRWLAFLFWGVAVMILHAMLMSYSRGAMISSVVGLVWVLWHHRPRKQALAILAVTVMAVSVLAGPEIRGRFQSTADFSVDSSAQSRLESWAAGWEIALEHPITGTGIRNSKFFSDNYGADRMGRTIHSQYLQIAADTGIPAMLIYVAIVVVALHNARHSRRLCREYLADHAQAHPDKHPDAAARDFIPLSLGAEASLLIFATGAAFLSVEVVELPWLMIVLMGVLPQVTEDHLDALKASASSIGRLDPLPPLVKKQHRLPMPTIRPGWVTP